MTCECQAFYIGKTKRPFFNCIRDNVSLVQIKKMETPISRYMGLCHDFNDSMMHFFALEHVPPNQRGGTMTRYCCSARQSGFPIWELSNIRVWTMPYVSSPFFSYSPYFLLSFSFSIYIFLFPLYMFIYIEFFFLICLFLVFYRLNYVILILNSY